MPINLLFKIFNFCFSGVRCLIKFLSSGVRCLIKFLSSGVRCLISGICLLAQSEVVGFIAVVFLPASFIFFLIFFVIFEERSPVPPEIKIREANDYLSKIDSLKTVDPDSEGYTEDYGTLASFTPGDSIPKSGCSNAEEVIKANISVTRNKDIEGCSVKSGLISPELIVHHNTDLDAHYPENAQVALAVSPKVAWMGGAYAWDEDKLARFADDRNNLVLVRNWVAQKLKESTYSEIINHSDMEVECEFTKKYVDSLVVYNLAVTDEDREALREGINDQCKPELDS